MLNPTTNFYSADEDGDSLVTPLLSLPTRKKQPQYYLVVKKPIDMSMIKQKIKSCSYDHLSSFNADVMLLFSNVEVSNRHLIFIILFKKVQTFFKVDHKSF